MNCFWTTPRSWSGNGDTLLGSSVGFGEAHLERVHPWTKAIVWHEMHWPPYFVDYLGIKKQKKIHFLISFYLTKIKIFDLHVLMLFFTYPHVQIQPTCLFILSNVDPLHEIILSQNIWWSLNKYIFFYYWCNISNFLILVRSNEIRKWSFFLFFILWSIYRDNLRNRGVNAFHAKL